MLDIKTVAEKRVPVTTATDKKSRRERIIFLLRLLIANDVKFSRDSIILYYDLRDVIAI
jgi:hypothetical protein